jgi:hypothetical protein
MFFFVLQKCFIRKMLLVVRPLLHLAIIEGNWGYLETTSVALVRPLVVLISVKFLVSPFSFICFNNYMVTEIGLFLLIFVQKVNKLHDKYLAQPTSPWSTKLQRKEINKTAMEGVICFLFHVAVLFTLIRSVDFIIITWNDGHRVLKLNQFIVYCVNDGDSLNGLICYLRDLWYVVENEKLGFVIWFTRPLIS